MSHLFQTKYLQEVIRIAFSSLLRHRMRSLLSVLGVVGGVAAVFATLSIGEGAKQEVLAGIRSLGLDNIILRRGSLSGNEEQLSGMAAAPGLHVADVPILSSSSKVVANVAYLREVITDLPDFSTGARPSLVAVSASYRQVQGFNMKSGRFISVNDENLKKMVCVLGESLSRELGSRGRIGENIRIGDQLFLVVGHVKSSATDAKERGGGVALARNVATMIFIPFGTHIYLRDKGLMQDTGGLDEIIVKTSSRKNVETILPLIRRTMDIQHRGRQSYELIVPRQLMQQAKKTQRIFNFILASIGGISLIVGGIGIMNVLLATVSERTREIGIRRAVGASREDIIAQFLAESILLTAAGGMVGIIAGLCCSWLIAHFARWNVAIGTETVLLPLLTSVVVGVCAGLYPAVKAGRMDPIQALRSA